MTQQSLLQRMFKHRSLAEKDDLHSLLSILYNGKLCMLSFTETLRTHIL